MSRQRSPLIAQRNDALLQRVQALKAEHPFWGYRRIWAYLRFVEQWAVNKKRVWRLMREHHLVVPPTPKKAKRTPTRSKPKPTKPNEWWGIDMTKVMVEGFGWVYVVLVLDWYTKKIVGYYAGVPCTARHWLAALDMAVNREFPTGARDQGVSLMSDNGCQPTSLAFMQACQTLGIHQVFTSYNNPKGNADTERMMRTLKEECLWLQEWTSAFELIRALEVWITDYNTHYLHSSLGYQSPRQFEGAYHLSHGTPFVAA
jgi:transposase InsO family protein